MNLEILNIENRISDSPFRVIEGLDNTLYFVGSDVATIMGYKMPQKMYAKLKSNEKVLITPSNWQNISQDFVDLKKSVKRGLSDGHSTIHSNYDIKGSVGGCSETEQSPIDLKNKNASNNDLKGFVADCSETEQTDEIGVENFKAFAKSLGMNSNAFKVLLIAECGFYNIVFGSRTLQAKKVRKWFVEEILPEIRKRNKEQSKSAGLGFILQDYTETYHKYQKLNSMLKDKIENREQNIKDKERQIVELESKIAKLKKIIVELI